MPRLPSTELVRRLSPSEHFIWILDQATCTNHATVAQIDGAVEPRRLATALAAARKRHPALRACVGDRFGDVHFAPQDGTVAVIPLKQLAFDSWESAVAAHLDLPFDTLVGPLARCLLFPGEGQCVVALVLHHAVADALAGFSLMSEVLRWATGEIGSAEAASMSPLPSVEQMFPPAYRGVAGKLAGVKVKLAQMREQGAKGRVRAVPGFRGLISHERRTRITRVELDVVSTAGLVERCRAEKTTVQGAIGAAMLLAVRAESDWKQGDAMALVTPVNLRDRLDRPFPPGYLANCIGIVTTAHRPDAAALFWDLAREYSGSVHAVVARGDAHLNWLAMPPRILLPPNRTGGKRMNRLMAIMPPGVMVTNTGRTEPIGLGGGARLRALTFAICPNSRNAASICASTYDGVLRVNFTYPEAVLSADRAERLARAIGRELTAAGTTG